MRASVSEERENGKGAGSQAGSQVLILLPDTPRYIHITDLARRHSRGWVGMQRKPMSLSACVSEERDRVNTCNVCCNGESEGQREEVR